MSHPIPLNVALANVPSLATETAHSSRSADYRVISTREVLERMENEGFQIFQANEKRVRLEGNRGFQKHLVRMRHVSTIGNGAGVPDIILTNAHNGNAAFKLFSGWFEFACLNGLIMGEIDHAYSVRHTGDVASKVIDAAYRVIGDADKVNAEVSEMRATLLPRDAIEHFTTRAHALRFGESDRAPVSPAAFNITRRVDDDNSTLWSVYNRVQENTIRGGMRGRIVGTNGRMRRASVRAVTNIDRATSINSALHGIAREMLATYAKSTAPAMSLMYRAA